MHRAKATLDALTLVTRARSMDDLLAAILHAANEAVPSAGSAIAGPLIAPYSASRGDASACRAAVAAAREPTSVPEVREGGQLVVVPISSHDRVLGTLAAVPIDPSESEDALERLAVVASHGALAIDRLRLAGELTRSRDELATVLESVSDGIVAHDRDGRPVYANTAAAHISGFGSTAEYLALTADEIASRFTNVDEQGRDVPHERLPGIAARSGRPHHLVVKRRFHQGGQERWLDIRAVPVRGADGGVDLVVTVLRDVSAERHELGLRAALAEATAALASSLDYEVTLRDVARIVVPRLGDWCLVQLLDGAALRTLAVEHADAGRREAGRSWLERWPTDPTGSTGVAQVVRTGEPLLVPSIAWESVDVSAQDRHRVEALRALGLRAALIVPVRAGGRVIGALSLLNAESGRAFDERDMQVASQLGDRAGVAIQNARLYRRARQERQRADAERERLLVTLGSIADAVVVTDAEGRVATTNAVAEQLTGWSHEDAVGRPLTEVMPLTDEATGEPVPHPILESLTTGRARSRANHTVLHARDGFTRVIEESVAPITTARDEIIGGVLVFRDVTARRRLDADLARASRLDALGVLAGGIAHDFNNLLAVIVGNLSILDHRLPTDDPLRKRVAAASVACDRGKDLTRQLLTFSRGGAPLKAATSLEHVIRETAGFVLPGSTSRVRFEFPADLWRVEGDFGQLSQLFHNLLINADQAMSGGGTITVRARNVAFGEGAAVAPGRYVEVEVEDEGPGVSPAARDRLFDPFFTTRATGTGLGLATAYSIARRHGGGVALAPDRPGRGALFVVRLPATDAPLQAPAPSAAVPRGTGRVLVMDDDESLLDLARMSLEDLGYECEVVTDGRAAVEAYRAALSANRRFDAVILDLTVAGGSGGLAALKEIAALDGSVRAIVSSGYSNDPVIAGYREHGFAAVLPKPYRLEELARVVADVLAQPAEPERP